MLNLGPGGQLVQLWKYYATRWISMKGQSAYMPCFFVYIPWVIVHMPYLFVYI
jgi:hypothetical protein